MARIGTGFTNLNKYIQANKGSTLSPYIGGQIKKDVDSTQGLADTSINKFGQDVQSNRLGTESDTQERGRILNTVSSLSDPQQVAGGTDQTPDVLGQSDIDKYRKFTGGQYAGPNDVQDSRLIQSRLNDLRDTSKQLSPTNTAQKFALLNRYVNDPKYTAGKRNLDTLFLNPNELGGVRKGIQQAGRGIESGLNSARGAADVARSEAAEFGKASKEELGLDETGNINTTSDKGLAKIRKNLQERFNRDKTLKADEYNQTQNIPGDINVTHPNYTTHRESGQDLRNYLNKVGLNDYDVQNSYGLVGSPELSQIFNRSGIDPTMENIASLPEYAQYSALSKLGNLENNYLSDPSMANKYYETPGYSVNKNLLTNLINSRKSTYDQQKSQMDADITQQQNALEALRLQKERITNPQPGQVRFKDMNTFDQLVGNPALSKFDTSTAALRQLMKTYGQDEPEYWNNPLRPFGHGGDRIG